MERVITLAPNVTELVASIGAQGRIIATDDFSNDPAGIERLPKVGGLEPNLERVAALRPDLVLASTSGNSPALAPALANLDIPLYVVKTDRVRDIPRVMRDLGRLLGAADAERRADDFLVRLGRARRQRSPPPRVLFLVWADPLYVAGRSTYMDDLFGYAGADNGIAPGVTGWPQYSMEALIAAPPDVILFPRNAVGVERIETLFASDRRWRALAAVREGRYFPVDDDRFSRPGPRLAEALIDLNRILDSVSF